MSVEAIVLTFLLNALWQVPAVATVGWLSTLVLRSGPAAYRHMVWVAALALATLLPPRTTVWPEGASVVIPLLSHPALPDGGMPADREPKRRPGNVVAGAVAADPALSTGRVAVWTSFSHSAM